MSFHGVARERIRSLAEGAQAWAIPWPCIHETLAIISSPKVFRTPTPIRAACDQIEAWLESPSLVVLTEPGGLYWKEPRSCLVAGNARGAQVHDARKAAPCIAHGVTEPWPADRHLGRTPRLRTVNPLTTPS